VFTPPHFGLYFTPEHVQLAREQRDKDPFVAAWKLLHEHEETGVQAAQWLGLRYRFEDDALAGEQAAQNLMTFMETGLNPDMTYVDALQETLVQAHTFEMIRDHAAMVGQAPAFLDAFAARITYFNTLDYQRSYVEDVLLGLVNLVAGIVLEREDLFQYGVGTYETVIREDIHPQGYIQKVVEAHDGGGLLRQIMVVGALVQMAETARHAGVDLWNYSFRGVSVMTAFSYLLYYYFYPEKWRWDAQVTNDPFREYCGYLEMVNRQAYPKDLKPILDELRPLYDAAGGGITTLSHGMSGRPKRRLFG
jgi:hypothetical protein